MSTEKTKPLTVEQEVEAALRFMRSVESTIPPCFPNGDAVQAWIKQSVAKFAEQVRRETEPNAFEEP